MAGHSKFKNIMHRKGAQDKKRSSLFSKLRREITVAASDGQYGSRHEPAASRGGCRCHGVAPRTISALIASQRAAELYDESATRARARRVT